jgi:hypothetical protein
MFSSLVHKKWKEFEMHTIAVDAREDDVAQTPTADCLGSVFRFVWI